MKKVTKNIEEWHAFLKTLHKSTIKLLIDKYEEIFFNIYYSTLLNKFKYFQFCHQYYNVTLPYHLIMLQLFKSNTIF